MTLFANCQVDAVFTAFNSSELVAVAFPADLPPEELEKTFETHGIETMINERSSLIPMTDFVRLHYLSFSDFSRRVLAEDPRNTPLSSLLTAIFSTTRTDDPWRVWYVPVASPRTYQAIQDVFSQVGTAWAWDAQPSSPAIRFLWIIWSGWTLWLLLDKKVKDRLYHVVLIFAWIPVAFFQSLPAAALMVVGQGFSTVVGVTVLATGRSQGLTKRLAFNLLLNAGPFLLSLLFLVSLEPKLLLPMSASIMLTILIIAFRDSILPFIHQTRLHRSPPFRLILEETIRDQNGRLGIQAIIPLILMIMITTIVPYKPDTNATYRLSFKMEVDQRLAAPDYSSMIRSHIVYQEALAWGRLGDAEWMAPSYTRPYRFEIRDNHIVRDGMGHGNTAVGFQNSSERDKELRLVLEHTGGGSPAVVLEADIPRIRAIQLDSMGVVFYIMALAPFCVLGLHRISQSRRRTITSYSNRQVA